MRIAPIIIVLILSFIGYAKAENYEEKLKPVLNQSKELSLKYVNIVVERNYNPDKNNKWCYSELFELQNKIFGSYVHYVYYMTIFDKLKNEEDKSTVYVGREHFLNYTLSMIKSAQKEELPKLQKNCFDEAFHDNLKTSNNNWNDIILSMKQ